LLELSAAHEDGPAVWQRHGARRIHGRDQGRDQGALSAKR
jgi:hypothetical protein